MAWTKPLYLHIICSVQLSLLVNFCTTFFSNALAKFCAWNAKLATLTSCSAFFFLLPQVTMYISSSVTMHLLGSITESTEFQSNSTGFKLFSSTDIRFEQIKRKQCDLRIYLCIRSIRSRWQRSYHFVFLCINRKSSIALHFCFG